MRDRLLLRLTARLPARAIDVDGRHYLERYYVGRWCGVTVYLHRYLDADDGERGIHDHPWRWAVGIPLVGAYDEERVRWLDPNLGIRTRIRPVRWWQPNLILATTFHRIAWVAPGTWTLFLHGSRIKGWGFLTVEELCTDHGERMIVTYDQPGATAQHAGWHRTAPPGAVLRAERGTE